MDHAWTTHGPRLPWTTPNKAKKKMKSAASLSRWLKLAKSPIEACKITHSVYSSRRTALPAERSKTSAKKNFAVPATKKCLSDTVLKTTSKKWRSGYKALKLTTFVCIREFVKYQKRSANEGRSRTKPGTSRVSVLRRAEPQRSRQHSRGWQRREPQKIPLRGLRQQFPPSVFWWSWGSSKDPST